MSTRRILWESVKWKPQTKLVLDGRIGGESMRIYAVNPCDPRHQEMYEKTLYSDEEAEELPCTERSVAWILFLIGGLICKAIGAYFKDRTYFGELVMDTRSMMLVRSGGTADSVSL